MRIYFILLVLGCVFFTTAQHAANAALTAEKGANKIHALHGDIVQLEGELKQQKGQQTTLSKQILILDEQILRAQRAIKDNQNTLTKETRQLTRLQANKARLQHEKKIVLGGLEAYLVTAYMSKNQRIVSWIGGQSVSDGARHAQYRRILYEEQRDKLSQLERSVMALATVETDINTRLKTIKKVQGVQVRKKQTLRQRYQTRKMLLASVSLEIEDTQQAIKNLQAQELALKKLLRRLAKKSKAQGRMGKDKGRLPWPVNGRMVVHFGEKRVGQIPWKGVIIQTPLNSEVKAVFSGRVVFSGRMRGYGRLTIIDHGGGTMSLYGYNDRLLHATGESIGAGAVVAYSGLSEQGREGVYFEVRIKGLPVNPAHWLKRMKTTD